MRIAAALPLILSGCGFFEAVDNVKDKVRGLTNPMVGQAWILGVEDPQDPNLAPMLELAGFAPGTTVNAYLADAKTSGAADDAPVEGARVELHASALVRLDELGEGSYALSPEDGPPYQEGAAWDLVVDFDGDTASLAIVLPPAADLDVPATHPPQADLVLDFTGQAFQSALIFVLDQAGQVTWTNEPRTASEAIDFAGSDDDMELVIVPGIQAFPGEGIYAVGIAGLRSNDPADIENMNTALNNLQAGRLRWNMVSTLPATAP